jgi:hypothetical protein
MTFLHILRSEPDEVARSLMQGFSGAGTNREVPLYLGPVDYDKLVQDIFQSDRVICWWASRSAAEVSRR